MRIGDLLKSSSPTIHSGELVLERYTKNSDMCILSVLKTYLEHTKMLRGSGTRLFIASQKPYHPISTDTFFTKDKASVIKCRNRLISIFSTQYAICCYFSCGKTVSCQYHFESG